MQIKSAFGHYVEKWSADAPQRARFLLKTGWKAQNLKFRMLPDRRLCPADRYLARLMMNTMLRPLIRPEQAALVSIFTPCQLLQETGLSPYNVESFSCYLAASRAESAFSQCAEGSGLSETLCSYHKTFLGAAMSGLLPPPKCIVYTTLACDANLLTFPFLAQYFHVPSFAIDVPAGNTDADVRYAAEQLRDLKNFLEHCTGNKVEEAGLCRRMERSRRTLETFDQAQKIRKDHYIASDLVSPLYCGMTNNILLGTEEQERYVNLLRRDITAAPPAKGKRIYWMHTIPFWSQAAAEVFQFREDAQIVCCELSQTADSSLYAEDPYVYMALRLVNHAMNGSISRRIHTGIRHAAEMGADGAIWFNHWGCKHTLGGAQLAKRKFEEAGIPLLILDGDGCDRSRGGEGQTATRLEAFLEMLGQKEKSV